MNLVTGLTKLRCVEFEVNVKQAKRREDNDCVHSANNICGWLFNLIIVFCLLCDP
jgi:hypothetical protein